MRRCATLENFMCNAARRCNNLCVTLRNAATSKGIGCWRHSTAQSVEVGLNCCSPPEPVHSKTETFAGRLRLICRKQGWLKGFDGRCTAYPAVALADAVTLFQNGILAAGPSAYNQALPRVWRRHPFALCLSCAKTLRARGRQRMRIR